MLLAPLYPALEMIDGHLVAIHDLALEISIDFMKIESVAARDEALRLENISTKFVDIARCPRIISSYCKTTVKGSCLKFESLHVICLPAVHAQMKILKLLKHLLSVDSKFGVTLSGDLIRLMDKCFFHRMVIYY